MNEPRVKQDISSGKVIRMVLIVAILSLTLAGGMLFDPYLRFIRFFS